jgi:bacteriochlorophyll 4-vinyl reductase
MTESMTNTQGAPEARFTGTVATVLPLTLLQAVRDSDHPGEVLEEEDLPTSLPRRLGLTVVVESQIRRYEATAPWDPVPLSDAVGLMRLVLRRADAEAVFRETGRRIARLRYGPMPRPLAAVLRRLPRAFAFTPLRAATRKLLRRLVGNARFEVKPPLHLRMDAAPTARLEGQAACALYTGVLEALLERYLGETRQVVHVRCRSRGEEACEWRTRGEVTDGD